MAFDISAYVSVGSWEDEIEDEEEESTSPVLQEQEKVVKKRSNFESGRLESDLKISLF